MNNKVLQISIICFLCIVCINCTKNTELDNSINKEYPTTVCKLDSSELSQLRKESPFPLDEYGLFDINWLNLSGQTSLKDTLTVVNLAKNAAIKYSRFSNVISKTDLVLKWIRKYESSSKPLSFWEVRFENQIYEDIEIIYTEIEMRVVDSVEYISGHHFKDIYIPKENLLPKDTIITKIIGHLIDVGGSGGQKEVTEDSIGDNFIKKICRIEKEDCMQFRVVWQIPIYVYKDIPDYPDLLGWYLYVDVITGEIVYTFQVLEV